MNKANALRRVTIENVPATQPSSKEESATYLKRIDAHLVSLREPHSFEAEQYRRLRHVLEGLRRPEAGLVVAITSPVAGDGKSLTSMNLAAALAQDSSAKVLLMDLDIRRQSATLRQCLALGETRQPGVLEAIGDPSLKLEHLLRRFPPLNIEIVLTGTPSLSPYEALKSRRLGEILTEARRHYDFVIVDAPPVVPVSDCQVMAQWLDGFIMVVTAHRTPREMLGEALDVMESKKILGLIFNCSDQFSSRYYDYYYGYGERETRRKPGRIPRPHGVDDP
jgi:capsular exopolysaccharide synthesis family protein